MAKRKIYDLPLDYKARADDLPHDAPASPEAVQRMAEVNLYLLSVIKKIAECPTWPAMGIRRLANYLNVWLGCRGGSEGARTCEQAQGTTMTKHRDRLAERYIGSPEEWDLHLLRVAARSNFNAGYDAAMREADALLEALEFYASGEHAISEFNDGGRARVALANWEKLNE